MPTLIFSASSVRQIVVWPALAACVAVAGGCGGTPVTGSAPMPVLASTNAAPSSVRAAGAPTTNAGSIALADFGFETPSGRWSFDANSGVRANASDLTAGNPSAPEGTHVAYLRSQGAFTTVVATFARATSYVVTVATAQRARGNHGGQDYEITLDGAPLATVKPASSAYADVSTPAFAPGAGTHTLGFRGLDTAGGDNMAFLDNVRIVPGTGGGPTPVPQPTNGPALSIDATASRHNIDAKIYGITWFYNSGGATDANFASFAKSVRLPVNRHGGDATTRYNWNVDSSNAGADWFFTAGNGEAHGTAIPGASADHMIAANIATATRQILTVPIIEYIDNDSPWHCGFPRQGYPAQQSYNPYVPYGGNECGNGYDTSGNELFGNDPTQSDVANSPSTQQAWVTHLVSKFGPAAKDGVFIYEMDNEPTAWGYEHRDIHPAAVTCDEVVAQTQVYAAAVKAGDPTARVLGPGDIAPADTFACHGTTNGLYYLQQMKLYQTQHGKRILDYYSMHYPGCCGGDALADTVNHIHLHKAWIAQAYPGTGLGYDEWNDGTSTDFPAALLHGDTLGIFGREGVNVASFWGFGTPQDATAFVWRMFRNYDGKGSEFGQTSVSATSADTTKLTVYAAQRLADGALTVVVINKGAAAITSTLTVSDFTPTRATAVGYTYAGASSGAIVHNADQPFDPRYFVTTYPASSLTMLVLR